MIYLGMLRGIGMDIWNLRKGTKVLLDEGTVAEVVVPTEDGQWVKVRYLKVPGNPSIERTEDLCSSEEILQVAET
jgi:hypothetical protein